MPHLFVGTLHTPTADEPPILAHQPPLAWGCRALFVSFGRTSDGRTGVTFELRWMAKDHDASAREIVNALSKAHDVADFSMQSTTN